MLATTGFHVSYPRLEKKTLVYFEFLKNLTQSTTLVIIDPCSIIHVMFFLLRVHSIVESSLLCKFPEENGRDSAAERCLREAPKATLLDYLRYRYRGL